MTKKNIFLQAMRRRLERQKPLNANRDENEVFKTIHVDEAEKIKILKWILM